MNPKKVQGIQELPRPANLRELRAFLGMTNFYRKFVRGYSDRVAALTQLLRKEEPFVWGDDQETSFLDLKNCLVEAPVLRVAEEDRPFVVHTDASDIAFGGVLMQNFGMGLQPIAFMSKKLTKEQMNWPAHDKELFAIVQALKEWKHLLQSEEVTVYTDNRASTYVMTKKELTRKEARWVQFLGEYQRLRIKYIPGKNNPVADALSRAAKAENHEESKTLGVFNMSVSVEKNREVVLRIQQNYGVDPWCVALRRYLQKENITKEVVETLNREVDPDKVRMEDGLLVIEESWGNRMIIPTAENTRLVKDLILQQQHDSATGGHPGRDRLLHAVSRMAYWQGMRADVESYVSRCLTCQKVKPSNQPTAGLMTPLGTPKGRWTEVTMDFAGPLPLTKNGNDLLVVFVDRFSKMVHIAPLKQHGHGAVEVANAFLDNVFRLHGLPEKIISDRGRQFVSALWQNLFKTLGTELALSTAFHPQTDGQSERAIRTLKQMLQSFCHEKPNTWDEYLGVVEFAYNNAVNSSTKFTPFFINFGRHPLVPVHMQTGLPNVQEPEEVDRILQKLYEGFVLARAHLDEAQVRMAAQGNRRRRNHNYQVGDWVWLSARHIKYGPQHKLTKFNARWMGPYRITRLIGGNAVQLELPAEMKVHPTFNVDRIKAKIGDDPPEDQPNSLLDKNIIHGIVDQRTEGGVTELKLQFKNETPEEMWVSKEVLLKKFGPEFLASLGRRQNEETVGNTSEDA